MRNKKIRDAMSTYNVYVWELADLLEVAESTMYRMLRHELPEQEQDKIVGLITDYGRKKQNDGH